MTIANLNVLQSGTVASVTPINENFETIRVALNTVEQSVTTNRTYLDNKVIQINSSITSAVSGIKTEGNLFCVNSGPRDSSGNGNIVRYSGSTLSFGVPFTATNIQGNKVTVSSLSSISLAGYSDGTYNIFVDLNGNIELLKNTIYVRKTTPTANVNDIWLDISQVPLVAKRYTSSGWTNFLKIPVGSVTVASNTISGVKTSTYNQNGYEINRGTMSYILFSPDYSRGVNKSNGNNYTANEYGWIYAYDLGSANTTASVTIDGQTFTVLYAQFAGTAYACGASIMLPVNKGSSYSATGLNKFIFYPARTY